MTDFPNGVSSYGIPLFGSSISTIPGFSTSTPLFVDSTNGSDGNDGLTVQNSLATISSAISAATPGDVIFVSPGQYDETVTVDVAKVTIVGLGGRGAAFIEPSTEDAGGMIVTADDVTLINLGVAAEDDTSAAALTVTSAARFRAYGCKIEGGARQVLINGTADDQTADLLLVDCEICWGTHGIIFDDSLFGYPTQIRVENCWFHDLVTSQVGVAASGLVKDLVLKGNTFDNAEDGTAPTDYILLSDNGNTGVITLNSFATATNDTAVITIGTGLKYPTNYTEAGASTARPA